MQKKSMNVWKICFGSVTKRKEIYFHDTFLLPNLLQNKFMNLNFIKDLDNVVLSTTFLIIQSEI